MKILFLSPHVDSEHQLVQALQAQGHGVLLPLDANEAWQVLKLHGRSVDLALIHREGASGGDEGAQFLHRLKSLSEEDFQADLPVIFSSSDWDQARFAAHQNTPDGANAYIHWPFTLDQLQALMDQVFHGVEGARSSTSSINASTEEVIQALGSGDMSTGGISKLTSTVASEEAFVETAPQATRSGAPDPTVAVLTLDEPVSHEEQEIELPEINLTELRLSDGEDENIDAPAKLPRTEERSLGARNTELMAPALSEGVEGGLQEPGAGVTLEEGAVPAGLSPSGDAPAPVEIPTFYEAPAPEEMPASPPVLTAEPIQATESAASDEELASELPYLFGSDKRTEAPGSLEAQGDPGHLVEKAAPGWVFSEPVGDAVVPGGAANSPDTETLKKYLILREQDVAVLAAQLKTAQENIHTVESALKAEKLKSAEYELLVQEQNGKIEGFEKEKASMLESLQSEIDELRFQNKVKSDKAKVLERHVREAEEEISRLKERVRSDIRKIRVREKELENRLEITKKDSEALLSGRENKIIELKRKVDLLEFNMDLLQDRLSREKDYSHGLKERLAKAAQVVRVAAGLLDSSAVEVAPNGAEPAPSLGGGSGKGGEPKAS